MEPNLIGNKYQSKQNTNMKAKYTSMGSLLPSKPAENYKDTWYTRPLG